MNAQELKDFQEKERQEKERTDKAEQQTKAATDKENVWKADAQKSVAENQDKAIKDNIAKEQKALLEAHQKEEQRVKSLNDSAKEKPKEQHYNPVFDRAGMELEAWKQQQQQKQQQQKQPRQPHHYDRQSEDGMTRELNTVKQIMCKDEATRRLEKMTPEQRDTLKKSFEADMAKVGDNRKLTDAGLHHHLSEKIMDDKGVPRPDHTDLVGIAQGQRGMGRDVTATDIMRKHEMERYIQPEKALAQEKGKEPPLKDDKPKDGPKGPDKPSGPDKGSPEGVRAAGNPDHPGPAPAHAHHGHGHHMPWDKNPHEQHGGHGHHLSRESGQELAQGKPWENRADPDRSESRMAAQAREREQERGR